MMLKLATVIKEERAKNPKVLVVDAGDAFQGCQFPIAQKVKNGRKFSTKLAMMLWQSVTMSLTLVWMRQRNTRKFLKFPLLKF